MHFEDICCGFFHNRKGCGAMPAIMTSQALNTQPTMAAAGLDSHRTLDMESDKISHALGWK
jgi:hypothetical protein